MTLSRQEYIEIIVDHHENPRNWRSIEGAHIHASGGNPACGDIVIMYAQLTTDGRIIDASYQGEGCTISQSGASILTETLVGKTLDEILEMSFESIVEQMGREVVASRTRCATLALSTTKAAVDAFLNQKRGEPTLNRARP